MSRPDLVRESNDHIADQAVRLRFVSRVPMLCECGDSACKAMVLLTLDEYQRVRRDQTLYLTVPGHDVPGSTREHVEAEYWLYRWRH